LSRLFSKEDEVDQKRFATIYIKFVSLWTYI